MKNKTFKKLIVLGVVAFSLLGLNQASANYIDSSSYAPGYSGTSYVSSSSSYDNYNNGYYNNTAQQTVNYAQQPYTYMQAAPQVQYVQQPVQYVQLPAQIKYVQQPAQIKYVQAAPQVQYVQQPVQYVNTVNAVKTVPVTTVNTVSTNGPGNYVSYDYNPNTASAYGYNNPQQVIVGQTATTDNNGLTALTVNGSGSFMPSSVFQWFIVILLILAIVIIARMISKSMSGDTHVTAVH